MTRSSLIKNPLLLRIERLIKNRHNENKLRSLQKLDDNNNNNLIDFSSNDYISYARNRKIAKRVDVLYNNYINNNNDNIPILGSTGSRLLTGHNIIFHNTEQFIANFHKQKYCLLSNSGWDLNFGMLASLPINNNNNNNNGTIVIYDELSHNSLIMGIRSGRQEYTYNFKHNNIKHLKEILKNKTCNNNEIIIAVEAVYSMDGDICPIQEVLDLAYEYNAMVIVDEAHSIGVIGINGEGLINKLNLESHPNLLGVVYTYGKGLGYHGASLVTSHLSLINYMINYSRPLIYSTSLPIPSVLTIQAAYEELNSEDTKNNRRKLNELIDHFQKESLKLDLPILNSLTPIQAIMIPSNEKVVALSSYLRKYNYCCLPIRAPTVPEGSERIRIIIHAHNNKDEISDMCRLIKEFII